MTTDRHDESCDARGSGGGSSSSDNHVNSNNEPVVLEQQVHELAELIFVTNRTARHRIFMHFDEMGTTGYALFKALLHVFLCGMMILHANERGHVTVSDLTQEDMQDMSRSFECAGVKLQARMEEGSFVTNRLVQLAPTSSSAIVHLSSTHHPNTTLSTTDRLEDYAYIIDVPQRNQHIRIQFILQRLYLDGGGGSIYASSCGGMASSSPRLRFF